MSQSSAADGPTVADALVSSILAQTKAPPPPQKKLAARLAKRSAAAAGKEGTDGTGSRTRPTTASYEEAAALCRAKVAQIVAECRRVNQKYRDLHFDLDFDLRSGVRDCLESLSNARTDYPSLDEGGGGGGLAEGLQLYAPRPGPSGSGTRRAGAVYGRGGGGDEGGGDGDRDGDEDGGPTSAGDKKAAARRSNAARGSWPGSEFSPKSVKRVGDIFDEPRFFVDGPTANDVRQGHNGDCWLMAALCTLSNKPGLIERVCVARDEEVGVYGFVFHRDGEWFSEIIDDHLYLIKPDYDEARLGWSYNLERARWEDLDRVDSEEKYRQVFQSNSEALYFAQCVSKNETWLPLLEKAYAKAHGDYAAIEGGHTGEGIEDLTGGVTVEIFTSDILDKV
ncbi:hypothetical protein VTH06DRAFT_2289, partial [Thermothelomyces fergusii]